MGSFPLVPEKAPPIGLPRTSRGSEQRRMTRARRAGAAELDGPLVQTRSAVSPHRADGPSRRRRVALRRVAFLHATTPCAARRLLPMARLPRPDRPARSAACAAVPRTDRSGLDHGGFAEAPNSDGAAVVITPGGRALTPTSTCPPGSTVAGGS